jgi:beta-galactosidase
MIRYPFRPTIVSALAVFSLASAAFAAPPAASSVKFPTILYGASYYAEYMPYERLDKDVELMVKAGINLVRVGESTWGVMEPRDGVFEFDWLQRVLDKMNAAGIKVILGTPTYSIPAWLYRKFPEIQVKPINGDRYTYGLRQMTDLTHPIYHRYAERIIRKLVTRFKDHPAVIGYQLDNETHPSGTADKHVQKAFVEYLKGLFKTPQDLTQAWGLNYWGQNVSDWRDVPPRDGILNPGYKLEWERFQRLIATDFLAWQASIVRELKRPDQFISHDFAGFPTDVDAYDIAANLDIPSINIYMGLQDDMDGKTIAFYGDVARTLKGGNYLVTETTAQTTGWDSRDQLPPYPGQLRLAVYFNIAGGANLVAYWHWHSLHYGQETYWKGVLSHDLEPGRVYGEVSQIARELKKTGPQLANFRKKNKVAILWSLDSLQALNFMPFDNQVNYATIADQFYKTLYKLNVETDIIYPQKGNFADYGLIIVPPLYIASDALLSQLNDYIKGGGHVLMSFKSGFCNKYSTVRWQMAPGPLREAAGFFYQEFSNLRAPLKLKNDPFRAGRDNEVSVWAEFLVPEKAKALAYYEHPVFGKYPAITRNAFGQGTLTYEGTYLADGLQEKVVIDTLKTAGIALPDAALPAKIKAKHGTLRDGRPAHAYFNFSAAPQEFVYDRGAGAEMISSKAVVKGQRIRLAPWDLVFIREN